MLISRIRESQEYGAARRQAKLKRAGKWLLKLALCLAITYVLAHFIIKYW